jgi:superfamily II DNA or RNA helicase
LWHQLHILYPEAFPSKWDFLDTYAHTNGRGWGASVVKVKNERALHNMLKEYMRELTYKQAGMFLPDRIDKDVKLEMDKEFRKNVYDKLRIHYKLELEGMPEAQRFESAGAVLHMLRRILIDEFKLEAIKQIVEDIQHDRPICVFVWYKDSAEKVAEALDGIVISGDMKPEVRREIALYGRRADSFNEPKRIRVVTMASMTEGVDLSFMRDVIFAEQDYVPGKNYQAMTRVQRARTEEGYDKDPVVAYWPRYMNSVDEVVHTTARSRTTGNALTVLKEALEGI